MSDMEVKTKKWPTINLTSDVTVQGIPKLVRAPLTTPHVKAAYC